MTRPGGWCAAAAVPVVTTVPSRAQFPRLPNRRLPASIEDAAVERALRREPPVTTSLDDAVTEVPYLDGYAPADAIPATAGSAAVQQATAIAMQSIPSAFPMGSGC